MQIGCCKKFYICYLSCRAVVQIYALVYNLSIKNNLLYETKQTKNISNLHFGNFTAGVPGFCTVESGNYSGTGLPASPIYMILQTLMLWILGIFGFIAIIGFVISGIQYLTAAGDEEQQKRAKKAMYYSIMGVIVGLGGLIILNAATQMLGSYTPMF